MENKKNSPLKQVQRGVLTKKILNQLQNDVYLAAEIGEEAMSSGFTEIFFVTKPER